MKDQFYQLLANYQVSTSVSNDLWLEIEQHYSQANRHYHSLIHLQDLYQQVLPLKDEIKNWDVLLFSLFYHDIIYNATKSNNEEKSAALAEKRLEEIGVSEKQIKLCFKQIIATKSHAVSKETDTNYFTDADLSILGRDQYRYKEYCGQIRKEYSIYPMFMYKKGRRKLVQHFLAMDRIFKTDYFFTKFEAQARENLERELNLFLST